VHGEQGGDGGGAVFDDPLPAGQKSPNSPSKNARVSAVASVLLARWAPGTWQSK
jgi:hypothetical protein